MVWLFLFQKEDGNTTNNHRDEDLIERGLGQDCVRDDSNCISSRKCFNSLYRRFYVPIHRARDTLNRIDFYTCFNYFFRRFFFHRGIQFLANYGSIIANFLSICMIVAIIHAVIGLFIGHPAFVAVLTIIISALTIALTQFLDGKITEILRRLSPKNEVVDQVDQGWVRRE